jgi:5-methylthioadenosine/S-adenosylhomocysteine deaminase
MRAVLGIIAIEFPTRYAADADDYLAKGLAVRDRPARRRC